LLQFASVYLQHIPNCDALKSYTDIYEYCARLLETARQHSVCIKY